MQRELERGVEAPLEREVFEPSSSVDAQVAGSIVRQNDGWLARVTLSARGRTLGARELFSAEADCAALDRVLIVVLATLLDRTCCYTSGAVGARRASTWLWCWCSSDIESLAAASIGARVGWLAMFAPETPWPAFWLEAQGFVAQSLRDSACLRAYRRASRSPWNDPTSTFSAQTDRDTPSIGLRFSVPRCDLVSQCTDFEGYPAKDGRAAKVLESDARSCG